MSDILPRADAKFIDKVKLLLALGLPHWIVRLFRRNKMKSLTSRRRLHACPLRRSFHTNIITSDPSQNNSRSKVVRTDAFNLDFLLTQMAGGTQKLDFRSFTTHEKTLPLKIVTSSLDTLQSIILSRANGNFNDVGSLLSCIRSSMSVPGLTGDLMGIDNR